MTTTERDDEAISSIISPSTESSPVVRLLLSEIFREFSQVMALEVGSAPPARTYVLNVFTHFVFRTRMAHRLSSTAS
jgi:hypothetical protein